MTEEKKVKTEEVKAEGNKASKVEVPKDGASVSSAPKTKRKFVNKKYGGKKGRRKNDRPKSDYDQKIVSLRRVTRVVSGGRRFSFSVSMVIGDRNGSVGFGSGKSTDTSLAIEKAIRSAKKNLVRPKLTETNSIPFDVKYKYSSSEVMMVPAPGKGLKAGGAMRVVLELLGAKDVTGKILTRSKNHANNAKATIEALKMIGFKTGALKKEIKKETKKGVKKFVKNPTKKAPAKTK